MLNFEGLSQRRKYGQSPHFPRNEAVILREKKMDIRVANVVADHDDLLTQ